MFRSKLATGMTLLGPTAAMSTLIAIDLHVSEKKVKEIKAHYPDAVITNKLVRVNKFGPVTKQEIKLNEEAVSTIKYRA